MLGIGNTLLSDDGAGIYAAREVKKRIGETNEDVEVAEAHAAGLSLATLMSGYEEVVIADAIITEGGVPGTVAEIDFNDFSPSYHLVSQHGVDIFTAVELARRCGLLMPSRIRIIAIEIEDNVNVREECTPAVSAAIREAAEKILKILGL